MLYIYIYVYIDIPWCAVAAKDVTGKNAGQPGPTSAPRLAG